MFMDKHENELCRSKKLIRAINPFPGFVHFEITLLIRRNKAQKAATDLEEGET